MDNNSIINRLKQNGYPVFQKGNKIIHEHWKNRTPSIFVGYVINKQDEIMVTHKRNEHKGAVLLDNVKGFSKYY